MNIKDKLVALRNYFEVTRQAGHTTLLKEGVNNYKRDKFILAYKKEEHTHFDCKPSEIVSWQGMNESTFIGHNKPLAIDNGVMWLMLDEALQYIETLELDSQCLKEITKIIKTKEYENRS